MSFETRNERNFMVGILPVADGVLTRRDGQHFLGIYPDMFPARPLAGIAAIVCGATLAMYTERAMAGEADISLNALMVMYAERAMKGQADLSMTPYLYMGIDGDTGMIVRY